MAAALWALNATRLQAAGSILAAEARVHGLGDPALDATVQAAAQAALRSYEDVLWRQVTTALEGAGIRAFNAAALQALTLARHIPCSPLPPAAGPEFVRWPRRCALRWEPYPEGAPTALDSTASRPACGEALHLTPDPRDLPLWVGFGFGFGLWLGLGLR